MLRSSFLLSRTGLAARTGRQWNANGAILRRNLADKPSIKDSNPIVLPGSASSSTNEPVPQGPVKTSDSSSVKETVAPPSATIIPVENIPRIPTGPPKVQTASSTSIPPPDAPPRPKVSISPPPPPPQSEPAKPPRRTLRTILTTLIILSALGFGGGVYYARINDSFHDFFTEYVPYGEEAVLYLEERDFRKRFPGIAARPSKPRDTGSKVTIPSQSGVSWKVADEDKSQSKPKPSEGLKDPNEVQHVEKVAAVEKVKEELTPVKLVEKKPELEQPKETPVDFNEETAKTNEKKAKSSEKNVKPSTKKSRAPRVDEPSVWPDEIAPIEPIRLRGNTDPIAADLAKIINNIILVINADASNLNENVKFSSTIEKGKRDLRKAVEQIMALKREAEEKADEKINEIHKEYDVAAKAMIARLQDEMQDHEMRWRSELESAREHIQNAYENRLKAEVEKQEELNEKKLENKLHEQALVMQKIFGSEVKSRVEEERDGRLGKLSELKGEIAELEKLTTEWNHVLDANLKTQHLHVAVEAVRTKLEESSTIPRPFVRELAALKEIGNGDAVVDAAIASINPVAYQKGIPSSAQLIDRFRRVAGEVRKASLLPDEAGVASHASSYVLSKVMFRKLGGGVPDGDDVESVLARTEMLLEEGDLDNAAREMTTLKGWAARLSSDWLSECRKVLEVRQALDVIATEARLESLRVE